MRNTTMEKKLLRNMAILLLSVIFTACEKPFFDDRENAPAEPDANVTIRVSGYEMVPFDNYLVESRAAQSVTQLCSRLQFVIFDGETKVNSVSQKVGDEGFGTVSLNLQEGTYRLVIIAHNCDGNATVTQADKITFPSNKVTDTFSYCENITVSAQPATYDVQLKRAVAMFRLTITDALPDEVKKMKFYYIGGSSTFDATTGRGNVNSRQTVNIVPTEGQQQFEVYTFPHDETGKLKMTVTALGSADNTIQERLFEDVPIQRNVITQYKGQFFGSSSTPASHEFKMTADGEWAQTNEQNF